MDVNTESFVETKNQDQSSPVGDSTKDLTEAVEKAIKKLAEFEQRLVNMANKLEEHLKERDAHHPALVNKK